jgi:hypothetical protein
MGSPLRALYQSARRAELDSRHPFEAYSVTTGIKITNDTQVQNTTGLSAADEIPAASIYHN